MRVIGHRGAAAIEPENTIASIEAAVAADVDMIEFDVRVTKDNELVLVHDPNLLRIAHDRRNVADMTLREINLVSTNSGHPIPTFNEAMDATGDIPVLIDCKGKNWATLVSKQLKANSWPTPAVTAIDSSEMFRFKEMHPEVETYVSELLKPFEAIYKARLLKFTGISLNFWVLNPLAYHYAKRNNLKFMIFTVNSPLISRFLKLLYPHADIITNAPDRLVPLFKHSK